MSFGIHLNQVAFEEMSDRPQTDGSNGNGITDVNELLNQFRTYPLALQDLSFIMSYAHLLKDSKDAVLEIFDQKYKTGSRNEDEEKRFQVILKTLRKNLHKALDLDQEYFDDDIQ